MNDLLSASVLCKASLPFLRPPLMTSFWKKKLLHATPLMQELKTNSNLFECVLTGNSRSSDLSISVDPCSHNLPVLEKFYPHIPWLEVIRTVDPCLTWPIWLEFDVSRGTQRAFFPNVFLRTPPMESWSRKQFCHSVETVANLLGQDLFSTKQRNNLKQCFEVCQEIGFAIFQCGFMLERNTRAIRLIINYNKPHFEHFLKQFLDRIGCCKEQTELSFLLDKITSHMRNFFISLDIGEEIGKRVGVECFAHSQESWDHLFSFLVEKSVVTPKKAKACLDWQGAQFDIQSLKQANQGFVLYKNSRTVNHIKFIHSPGVALEAKIYLNSCHNVVPYRPF